MARKRRNYTDELKKKIVELYNSGKPRAELVREYELTPSALSSWINKCNNSGSFKAEDNRTPEENAEPQKCTHFLRRRSCTSRMQCRTDEEEWKSRSSDCQSGGSL